MKNHELPLSIGQRQKKDEPKKLNQKALKQTQKYKHKKYKKPRLDIFLSLGKKLLISNELQQNIIVPQSILQ